MRSEAQSAAKAILAIVAITFVSPPGSWGRTPWQFYLGIIFAAIGAALVTLYRPAPAGHGPALPTQAVASPASVSPDVPPGKPAGHPL